MLEYPEDDQRRSRTIKTTKPQTRPGTKITTRATVVAFLAGFAIIGLAGTSVADVIAYGSFTHFITSDGSLTEYHDRNDVGIGTRAYGLTDIGPYDGSTAPAGYVGAKARLFKGSTLCKQTTVHYNLIPQSLYQVSTNDGTPSCGSGTYHSDGYSYVFNGTGYDQHNTTISPNLTL